MKQGSVSNADLTRAKEQVKAAWLTELETESSLISDIGVQALFVGSVVSSSAVSSHVDAITAADVNSVSFGCSIINSMSVRY